MLFEENEQIMQERYDIYSFKTSLFEAYKRKEKNKVLVPIFKQYQRELLKILVPYIKSDFLDHLIKNNICSLYIVFSGVRVNRLVNIFFNYNFPDHVIHPRLEEHEEDILSRLIGYDKFIMSKQIYTCYRESIKTSETIRIKFEDPYHKKLVMENLLTLDPAINNSEEIDPEYFMKTYPETLGECDEIEVSIKEKNLIRFYYNGIVSGLTIECPQEHILNRLEALDYAIQFPQFAEKPIEQTKLKIDGVVTPAQEQEKKEDDDVRLDTIENIVGSITPFNTKRIIETFKNNYKIVLNDVEVDAVPPEQTLAGLDILKEFYLYQDQLKTICEQYSLAKWNGKFDEESVKVFDEIPIFENLVRFCQMDKLKQHALFGPGDGIKFINKILLKKYLKEHYSKEDLYILVKARYMNPAIKEIDIQYYYSTYFEDVFKYFNINYTHAYASFFRFMINYIMGEESGE